MSASQPRPLGPRIRLGLRRPANWLELVRFATVGASGYVVNLVVFALAIGVLDYRAAAVLAFCVAVLNNFSWNRGWTFRATGGHAEVQVARFFAVSLAAFGASLGVLVTLVAGLGMPELGAQALAVLCATPLSFLGNKLWTFDG